MHKREPMIIGVDFDNTIVSYDELMRRIAIDWGLISDASVKNKRQIRDVIRRLPEGEQLWQQLQISAYGVRMREAVPADGVKDFLLLCKQCSVPVYIVSHKTIYPNLGESRVNLREAAATWLEQQGFFAEGGLGINRANVYFEPSRAEKVTRIDYLHVTHFIDDLEETFNEPGFPLLTQKILYSSGDPAQAVGVNAIGSWAEIQKHLFPAANLVSGAHHPLP